MCSPLIVPCKLHAALPVSYMQHRPMVEGEITLVMVELFSLATGHKVADPWWQNIELPRRWLIRNVSFKLHGETEESCKEGVLSECKFWFSLFCVKKWLYIIPVSLDFENNASEDEILHHLCVVHELHLFRLPRKRWELTKNQNSYFTIFSVKFCNFTELWKHSKKKSIKDSKFSLIS